MNLSKWTISLLCVCFISLTSCDKTDFDAKERQEMKRKESEKKKQEEEKKKQEEEKKKKEEEEKKKQEEEKKKQEEEKKKSEIKVSHESFRNFMDSLNHDEYLKELISHIAYISEYHDKRFREINLFKRFENLDEEYDEETLPLNRNLFMHGLVDEKNVNYLMVQKAILAYSFFVQLYVLKTRNSKDARIKGLRRKGISRIPKMKRSFNADESRN